MKRNGKNNANSFKDMPKVHVVRIDNEQNRKQIAAEQAAAKQALYVDYWETMTENEYMNNVRMINTNQFDILSPIFQDEELLKFFKMKRQQENEQRDQESKTFFELLPQMSESVQKSMIEFINDHYSDEQTHLDYVSLVKMARERAIIEHEEINARAAKQAEIENDLAELAEIRAAQAAQAEQDEQELERNEEKEKFLSFWESLDESKKDLCITGMHSGYIAGFARKFVIENFKSENNFNMLLQNQIFIEKDLIVVSEEEQAKLERLGDLIEENLRNEELEEEETDRLEKDFFKGYAQETEIEEVITEILTKNPKPKTRNHENSKRSSKRSKKRSF